MMKYETYADVIKNSWKMMADKRTAMKIMNGGQP